MAVPKVSVIVPVYKVESYLMQCVDSILRQTLRDIEVILVDEGDRDACYAIMKFFEAEDDRVKIIHRKCGGYGTACNLGFDAAQGEYIGIVESDDFIEPTMYEEMHERASRLDVDVLKAPFFNYWDKRGTIPAHKETARNAELVSRACPTEAFNVRDFPQPMGMHPSIWSGIYRTKFLRDRDIRFITAKGAGYVDMMFRLRTLAEARSVAWLDRELYNYRQSNSTSSNSNWDMTAILTRWREIHDYCDATDPELYDIVGPNLAFEEYMSSLQQFFIPAHAATEAHFEMMKVNLDWIPEATIAKSPLLDASHREKIAILRRAKQKRDLPQNQRATKGSWLKRFHSRTFPPSKDDIAWRFDAVLAKLDAVLGHARD